MTENVVYCRNLIRQHDPDRFLLSLFAPELVRPGLWALFALNHEIAKTRELVTERQLGGIRLQWWREEIDKIYAEETFTENEILTNLATAIHEHDLKQADFWALLKGREADLEESAPATIPETLAYVENINAPLMKLAAAITNAPDTERTVIKLARNLGLLRLIYNIPFGPAFQPHILAGGPRKRAEIAKNANELLKSFTNVKPKDKFLRAGQALSILYYKELKKKKCDIFDINHKNPIKFKEIKVFLRMVF